MTVRAIGVIALMLAMLSPAPAAADARCKDRPFKGTMSTLVRLTAATGNYAGEGAGVATHLGRFTSYQEGRVLPTASGSFAGTGDWTVTAANGDSLTGTATLTVEGQPSGVHTTTQLSTITGGTGRFAHASGTFTIVFHVTPVSFDGTTVVNRSDGTINGRIRY